MPIVLYRVDDRLIHGQVVVGWGVHLNFDYIAVVDDELAESDWEQDLYRAGLPDTIEGRFLSVEDATVQLPAWQGGSSRGIVLTRDLQTMRRLAEDGLLGGHEVNLGGLHDAPGRRRVLPYLFLGDADRAELDRLVGQGVPVTARDVPGARKVQLDELREIEPD